MRYSTAVSRYSTAVRYGTCRRNRLQENNAYLLQSADKKVGEASDINKGFVFHDIYWLYHSHSCCDITYTYIYTCIYNIYNIIYIIYIYIYAIYIVHLQVLYTKI